MRKSHRYHHHKLLTLLKLYILSRHWEQSNVLSRMRFKKPVCSIDRYLHHHHQKKQSAIQKRQRQTLRQTQKIQKRLLQKQQLQTAEPNANERKQLRNYRPSTQQNENDSQSNQSTLRKTSNNDSLST